MIWILLVIPFQPCPPQFLSWVAKRFEIHESREWRKMKILEFEVKEGSEVGCFLDHGKKNLRNETKN